MKRRAPNGPITIPPKTSSTKTFLLSTRPPSSDINNRRMNNCWSAVVLAILAIVLVLRIEGTDAKRGCAKFGHSCYGGMGKRSDITDEVAQDIDQQEEDPAFVFTGPRSEYKAQRQRFPNQEINYQSPLLRQWLRSLNSGIGMRPREEK